MEDLKEELEQEETTTQEDKQKRRKSRASSAPVHVGAKSALASAPGITQDLTKLSGNDLNKAIFGIDQTSAKNIMNISSIYASPYGIMRSVPMMCRSTDCAYASTCMIPEQERKFGSRCPMEVAAVVSRFSQWCEHFGISIVNDTIDPKDMVDATLIKDLVGIEVQQLRAENKIAMDGNFLEETLLDIDRQCKPYYGEVISKASEFQLTLQQRKDKILSQLNATRKDKASMKNDNSPSDEAMKIFTKLKSLERESAQHGIGSVSDIQFDDDGNIIQDVQEVFEEEQPEDESVSTYNNSDTEDVTGFNNINLAEDEEDD